MRRIYKNLVEMQEDSCHIFRDNEIYGTKNQEGHYKWITYWQFKNLIDHCRGGLASLGVGYGDKVGIISHNCMEWAVACYATMGLGAQFVSMYENQTFEDWQYIINDADLKIILVANEKISEQIRPLLDTCEQLKKIIIINDKTISDSESNHTFQQLLKFGQNNPFPPRDIDGEELMGLIYTSGTTGKPKGVMLSHNNILSNIYVIADLIDFTPSDRSLSILPWAHIFGQLVEVHNLIYSGHSAGMIENARTIATNILEVRPTLLFAVPRVYNRIFEGINAKVLEAPTFLQELFNNAMNAANKHRDGKGLNLKEKMALEIAEKTFFKMVRKKFGGRLRYAISGASALNVKVGKFIDNLGIMVLEAYGLSETSPLVAGNTHKDRRFGSVGKVAQNDLAKVVVKIDQSVLGDNVQSCEEGEIVVYGPNVMKGYYKRPEDTRAVMTKDGGFRTGDLGRFDVDGFLYVTGRIKEQYKLENGKYVIPNIIEEQIKISPYVMHAYIYGDNRDYNILLIVVEMGALLKWVTDQGISDRDEKLLARKEVKALYQKEIEINTQGLKNYERPHKFYLLDDDWSIENGILTPSLKVKRQQIYYRYKNLIEELYLENNLLEK